MTIILVIFLVSVLCLRRFTMMEIEDKTKFGILAYAVNTMKSVMTDQVFNIKVETEMEIMLVKLAMFWFS